MKLRIQGNTIRIRVNDSEVNQLAQGTTLSSETTFPENTLIFSVGVASEKGASFEQNEVKVMIPQPAVIEWATTDQVSIAIELDILNDKKLSILVEKDMKL